MLEQFSNVLREQRLMAQTFIADPLTRTPILIIWVASFGGALHSAVTTFFYLEVGADEMDIGRIGFIMSLGSLILAPSFGYALDHGVQVFLPLLVTATACSIGCLWRGIATNVFDLYIGAALLSVGVNLWTVVLLHIAHCTSRDHRSQVLSAFTAQETGLRLLGKAVFPMWDFIVRKLLGNVEKYDTVLFRYRIHMGICALFCLFGTVAMLVERSALMQTTPFTGKLMDTEISMPFAKSSGTSNAIPAPTQSALEVLSGSPESSTAQCSLEFNAIRNRTTTAPRTTNLRYAAIVIALLIQSWSSTVLTVLWPLILRDRFHFAATEYGIVGFIASSCATIAIASFPTFEHHFGRIRTAATGASLASLACFLAFVALPNFIPTKQVLIDEEANTDYQGIMEDMETRRNIDFIAAKQSLLIHVVLVIVFLSSVQTLEPSLKSTLSLLVPGHLQNRSLGFMSTLGGIGGMAGNLVGTRMFQLSKRWATTGDSLITKFLSGGVLPFAVVGFVLTMAATFLWILDWQEPLQHLTNSQPDLLCDDDDFKNRTEDGNAAVNDNSSGNRISPQQNNGGLFLPLLKLDTSYEMKLD